MMRNNLLSTILHIHPHLKRNTTRKSYTQKWVALEHSHKIAAGEITLSFKPRNTISPKPRKPCKIEPLHFQGDILVMALESKNNPGESGNGRGEQKVDGKEEEEDEKID